MPLASTAGTITNGTALFLYTHAHTLKNLFLFFSFLNLDPCNYESFPIDIVTQEYTLTYTFSMKQMSFLVRTGIFLPLEWSLLLYA